MPLRATKALLLFGLTLFHALVVFNNTTDYASNFEFVRHVFSMDTTFPGNRAMWRAIDSPVLHTVSYWSIIAWEALTAVLCGWATVALVRALRAPADVFARARSVAIAALTSSLMLWLVAFMDVGGEWFLMWQSATWNGELAAFRMFTVAGISLLIVLQPEER